MDARSLLENLLNADSEEQVTATLEEYGFAGYDDSNWRPYGDSHNNSGPFYGGQSDPRGALTEKILNAVDAVLMCACMTQGIDPESARAPASMEQAAEHFFHVPGGELARLSPQQRSELAENIRIALCGKKPKEGYPCVIVVDRGEGQAPEHFAETLLSLGGLNKARIPFVQGKYNMGATGALRFCGEEHHYQLLVSRRHPNLRSNGSPEWGMSLVRRRPPMGGLRVSIYEYLAPSGSILTLGTGPLHLWPDPKSQRLQALEWGTFVKLYEYQIPERTNATLDFYYALNRRLYRLVVPARIAEMREYRGRTPEITLAGMRARLEEDRAQLEDGFPAYEKRHVEDLGELPIMLACFKTGGSTQHYFKASEAIAFTINGQAHAFLSNDFIRHAVGLKWLASSLLVEVDCSSLPAALIEKLFMSSRDRMSECIESGKLRTELTDCLKHHSGLKELNERRHKEALQRTRESPQTAKILENLLRKQPSLSRLLRTGDDLEDPTRHGSKVKKFRGQKYPTFLRLKSERARNKQCPFRGKCRVQLETDAENEYLDRPHDPGQLIIEAPNMTSSRRLWNGILTIGLKPTGEAKAGQRHNVRIKLSTRAAEIPSGWLEEEFQVEIMPEQPQSTGGNGGRPKGGLNLPEMRGVTEEEWQVFGWSEEDTVRIDRDEGKVVSFVNIDNKYLKHFCYYNPEQAQGAREQFKVALTVGALFCETLVRQARLSEDEKEKSLTVLSALILDLLPLDKLEESLMTTGTSG